MKLLFKRLHPEANLPTRQSEHAAGYDLHTIVPMRFIPEDVKRLGTGLAVAIPEGYYGRIAPRSGLAAKYGLDCLAGVIDRDYRGEIIVILACHGFKDVTINAGDRVAQLILERIATPEPEWADELPETVRGEKGFGSTGGN